VDPQATAVEPPLGSVGLTQIHGKVGRLIRFGQWLNGDGYEDYEHAFVFVGGGRIVEAEPGGAREADLSEYAANTVVWIECPPEYGQAVADEARKLVGTKYSFVDYLALFLHRMRLWVPFLRWYVRSSRRLICSALADRAARRGGWRLFVTPPIWEGYVTPGMLYRLYLKLLAPQSA